MAICKLNRNLLKSDVCGYSLPQVVMIYLANFEDVEVAAPSSDSAGCESVTAITYTDTGVTKFYKIEPAKDSASFEDALVVADNGTKYRTHTLTFTVNGTYDACLHMDLDALSLGKYIAVIQTAEGSYLMLGRLTGLEAETAVLAGGSDTNGMQIVLSANTTESAIPLAESAIEDIKGE
ncbi:MAG: hypothetical protein J6S67_10360 [Methanobrevibacter sp.]|nr:hypothetical protein [Methanobrevibacter sp.]